MSLHCTQCLMPIVQKNGRWECVDHGEIQAVLTTSRISPALRTQVGPIQRARQAAAPAAQAQTIVRQCRVCHAQFTARSPKHRFCPEHVGRLRHYLKP